MITESNSSKFNHLIISKFSEKVIWHQRRLIISEEGTLMARRPNPWIIRLVLSLQNVLINKLQLPNRSLQKLEIQNILFLAEMCQAQIKACQMGIPFPQEQRQTVMMKIKLMRILLLIWTKKKMIRQVKNETWYFHPQRMMLLIKFLWG